MCKTKKYVKLLACFSVTILMIIKHLKVKEYNLKYKCKCYINHKVFYFDGFLDTGNLIKSMNNNSLILIPSKFMNEMFNTNLFFNIKSYDDFLKLYAFLKDKYDLILSMTFYEYHQDKNKLLPVLTLERIEIYNNKDIKIKTKQEVGIIDLDIDYVLLPISIIRR